MKSASRLFDGSAGRAILAFALALPFASSVRAQTAPAPSPTTEPAQKLEAFEVTGSRLKRVDYEGPLPISVLSRERIESTAPATITELLSQQSYANFGGLTGNNEGTGFAAGATGVSLRGLNLSSTLVLVNGRRMAPYGFANGGLGGRQAFVNLNSIPVGAIERVEVLKDGASAIYGADAVAGVVNIILRKNYDGTELKGTYGISDRSDFAQYGGDFTTGAHTDKSRLMVMASYFHRDALFNRDRKLTANVDARAYGGFDNRSATGAPGLFTVPRSSVGLTGTGNIVVFGPPVTTTGKSATGAFSQVNPDTGAAWGLASSNYNFAALSGAIPATQRINANIAIDQDILARSQVVGFGEFGYNHERTVEELAPAPFTGSGSNQTPIGTTRTLANGTTVVGNQLVIPANNPFNPFGVAIGDINSGASATSTGTITNNWNFRFTEAGNRVTVVTTDAYRAIGGVRGKINDRFDWEVAGNYARSNIIRAQTSVSASAAQAALNQTDPTKALNVFGANRPEVIEGIKATVRQEAVTVVQGGDAKVSGPVFTLPGGEVGGALGAELRKESFRDDPDQLQKDGALIGSSPTVGNAGSRSVKSYYAELVIPIIGKTNAQQWLRSAEVQLAARHEDYSDFGTTTKPKASVSFSPYRSVLFRASYSEAFRAPSLQELFNSPSQSLTRTITDPKRPGNPAREVRTITRGNANLRPEESKSWTYGMVYTPSFIKGLNLSIDGYVIDRVNRISSLSGNFYAANEAAYPAAILRGPADGVGTAGPIIQLNSQFENLARDVVEGVDFEIDYARNLNQWGRLSYTMSFSYLYRYSFQSNPFVTAVRINGTSSTTDGIPEAKINTSAFWRYKKMNTGLTVFFIGPFDDLEQAGIPNSFRRVNQYWKFNYAFQYELPWNTRVALNVDNLFDRKPPVLLGSTTSQPYASSLYNDVGRYWTVSLTKKF